VDLSRFDGGTRSSGSIAVSGDGALIYSVSPDHADLTVVDAATFQIIKQVPLGRYPSHVISGPDGRVWVTSRGARTLSVVTPNRCWPVSKIPVGAEPIGLALSGDGKTIVVASAESGEVSAFDTETLARRWSSAVPEHPRAVAIAENEVLVSQFKKARVAVLSLADGSPIREVALNQADANMIKRYGAPFEAGQARDVLFDAKRKQAYVLNVQARAHAIKTDEPGSYGGTPGIEQMVPAVAAGVSTLKLDASYALLPDDGANFPSVVASDGSAVFNVPTAGVLGPKSQRLYVVFAGSDNVAVLDPEKPREGTRWPGIVAVAETAGSNPTGVAISSGEDRVFVYNEHTYSIAELTPKLEVARVLKVHEDPAWLTAEIKEGRRLFRSGTDRRVTNTRIGGSACAGCHPDGRDDGRTWLFGEGPRNTPLLTTGFLAETAPFHWAGEITEFHNFEIIVARMGGTGLSQKQFDSILAYLQSPAILEPDNPNVRPEGLTEIQKLGETAFQKAECNGCHLEGSGSDDLNHAVGTAKEIYDPFTKITVRELRPELQTPSLRHVYTTAPYLHTGEAESLKKRLVGWCGSGEDQHGDLAMLSDRELDALVEYLKTL
jgi:YVTN family beta-propeller protein